jgi:hypothetical protein
MKTPNDEPLTLEQMREETIAHLHVDSVFDDPEFKQILNDPTHPLHPAVLAKHKEAFPHLYLAPILDEPTLAHLPELPPEPAGHVSFWDDEPELIQEPIYKAVTPIISLDTPQNEPNQYPSIGQPPNAPSTSEFLPPSATLTQIAAPIVLPATLIDIPRAELPTICGHILVNRSLLSSNPNWNAQTDTQFEVCLEMITFIESVTGQFPTYLRLPHIQHDGYSKREEVGVLEFIAGKLQMGWYTDASGHSVKCSTVWDAVTLAYQQALSYNKNDALYTKESLNEMIMGNNKMARKLERALPKENKVAPVKVTVDRTAYDEVHMKWKAAIANKKKVVLELDAIIYDLKNQLNQEKIKAGITR